jgi:hypothetical protein
MTRNWIATAARALRMVCAVSARRSRRRAYLGLENLEHRIALSTYSASGLVSPGLNSQPISPGRPVPVVVHGAAQGTISLNLMKLVVEPARSGTLKKSAPPVPVQETPATSPFRIPHGISVAKSRPRAVIQSGRASEARDRGIIVPAETAASVKIEPTDLEEHPRWKTESAPGGTVHLK